MKKISPTNAVFAGYPCPSMYFTVHGKDVYHVLLKVKNKKGKGVRLLKIKVEVEL